jgi:hypothetical protein
MKEKTYNYKEILTGQIFILISIITYTSSWIMNYYLINFKDDSITGIIIFAAIITGFIGAVLNGIGISKSKITKNKKIKIRHILSAVLIIYIGTFLITKYLFSRDFTSEIFLIFIWLGLESCIIYILFIEKNISKLQLISSAILILGSITTGIVCYTIHYSLPVHLRFINGLIPYIIICVTMISIICFVLLSKNK